MLSSFACCSDNDGRWAFAASGELALGNAFMLALHYGISGPEFHRQLKTFKFLTPVRAEDCRATNEVFQRRLLSEFFEISEPKFSKIFRKFEKVGINSGTDAAFCLAAALPLLLENFGRTAFSQTLNTLVRSGAVTSRFRWECLENSSRWQGIRFCRRYLRLRRTVCHRLRRRRSTFARKLRRFQLFIHFSEGVCGEFQVFARMRGGNLRADARGAMRHDRIEKANHVDALLQHARGELL